MNTTSTKTQSLQDKVFADIRKRLVEIIQTSTLESIVEYFALSGATAEKKKRNDCILLFFPEPEQDLVRLKESKSSKSTSLMERLGHWSVVGNVQAEMKEKMNSSPAFSEAIRAMSPKLHDSIKKTFSLPINHLLILPLASLDTHDRQYYPLEALHIPSPYWFESKWNMKKTVNHFFKVPSIFILYFPENIQVDHKLALKDFAPFTFETMVANIKKIQELIRTKAEKTCNRDFCHKENKPLVSCELCGIPSYCNDGCLLKDRKNHAKDCERWTTKKPQNFTKDWAFCVVVK